MAPSQDQLVDAIAEVASAWRDPDHPSRSEAVEATLTGNGIHTEQGLAFSINFRAHQLTRETIRAWAQGRRAPTSGSIGVLHGAGQPFSELADALAVLLAGHVYVAAPPAESPFLLRSFLADLHSALPQLPVSYAAPDEIMASVDRLIVRADDEEGLEAELLTLPLDRRLQTFRQRGVAIVDGKESAAEREALAEDVLLFDGRGVRSVCLV